MIKIMQKVFVAKSDKRVHKNFTKEKVYVTLSAMSGVWGLSATRCYEWSLGTFCYKVL